MGTTVIWDAIALIMTSLECFPCREVILSLCATALNLPVALQMARTLLLQITAFCWDMSDPHMYPTSGKMRSKETSKLHWRITPPRNMGIFHCNDVIISAMASQITGVSIVFLAVCSGADQRKHQRGHQRSTSPTFVRGIHRWPVDSPHKWPVTRKKFPFDDVIMFRVNVALISPADSTPKGPGMRNLGYFRPAWTNCWCRWFKTHWGRDKWPPFSRRHFQMHFLEWKCIDCD